MASRGVIVVDKAAAIQVHLAGELFLQAGDDSADGFDGDSQRQTDEWL